MGMESGFYVVGGGSSAMLGPYTTEEEAQAALERMSDDYQFRDGEVVEGYSEASQRSHELSRNWVGDHLRNQPNATAKWEAEQRERG